MAEANEGFDPAARIQDFEKLQMWTPTPGVEGKRSKMGFGIRDGNPRITVFTNDPNDKIKKGVIAAGMNPTTFYAFLILFEKTIKSREEVSHYIECYQAKYEDDVRTKERVLAAQVHFGKDSRGMVWIELVAQNRPKIRFYFRMSDWHGIYNAAGEQIGEAEASVLESAAMLAVMRAVYDRMIAKNIEYAPPRSKGGAGGEAKPRATSTTSDWGNDIPF